MAEGISKELKIKAASEALTSQLFDLTGVIDPLMMALNLISKKIIDRSILERVRLLSSTKSEKACDVLTAVSDAVMINPDCFATFCDILDNEPVTKDIARILKENYEQELHTAQQSLSCTCTVLKKSFLNKLKNLLYGLKGYSYAEKKKTEQHALTEYVTCFIQAGCSSTDHLDKHLLALHEQDNLITDVSLYHWAKQLATKKFTEIATLPMNPIKISSVTKVPLFSKPVVYHASICSLAVNKTDAGEYQKFFKDKRFVPGHSFKEVSISRSKQERYLIATQDDSTYYIAFQSEPNITEWPKRFMSFENGINIQAESFPIDFITELLNNDTNRVVLTGFSFGGMLACSIAVKVWQRGYIPAQLLQENLVCITFAQPHLPVPQLADLARDRPEIVNTIHAIYFEEDIVSRLLRVLDLPCSTLIEDQEPGLQMKVRELPKSAFQDPLTQKLLSDIGQLSFESLEVPSFSEFVEFLRKILEGLSRNTGLSQSFTYYQLSYSTDQSSCLQFSEMTKDQSAIQSSHLKTDELLRLTPKVFKKHSMVTYCEKLFRGYLDKTPEYRIPSEGKAPVSLNMRPTVSGVTIHEHGSEVALVVEGTNFWFCYRLSIRGESIATPASKISGTSIKLNFDKESKPTLSALSDNEEVILKMFNHFMKSPVTVNEKVVKKEYPVSTRQRQLARLTPSQLIEVTYLSALLEKHPYTGPQPQSHKVTIIKAFLDKVVNVVPLESMGYAIAHGNDHVALQCVNVLDALVDDLPSSYLMDDGFDKATKRVRSGVPVEIVSKLIEQVIDRSLLQSRLLYGIQFSLNKEEKTLTYTIHLPDKKILTRTYSFDELKDKYKVSPNIDLLQLSGVKNINWLQHKLFDKVHKSSTVKSVICGLNISSLYGVSNEQLKSPIETLHIGKEKLASTSGFTSDKLTSSVSLVNSAMKLDCLDNSLMLKTVNDIRHQELAICTSLLAGFMEQHEINIPLMKSEKDHSKVLELSARASVGVWALSSLDFEHIQPILKQCRGEQLLVKIEDYIKGIIVEAKAMSPSPDDTQYAAKLQFIVQGAEKTVTCNSQYISYSLERQLADICSERKITEEIPLEKLVLQWEQLFEKNILSLVAKSHRPLIARWLKWALIVHNLREELAKYTAVGVVGLVNSGKSRLITTLFGIQIPSGTTEDNRTTVPFMYNLEDKVDGLDVVDFPGVDDRDESISGLADLLLTLAQIIIFVVDYRKVHTESSKKWLDRLQVEKVPVLVCLTFADKLYAEQMKDGEHLTDESKYPDKISTKHKLQAELARIKEKLELPSSHQIEFCSFSQDKDSILNCKEGRQRLRDVGISTPSEVGDWLVDTFKKRFGQDDLADRLKDFVHSS